MLPAALKEACSLWLYQNTNLLIMLCVFHSISPGLDLHILKCISWTKFIRVFLLKQEAGIFCQELCQLKKSISEMSFKQGLCCEFPFPLKEKQYITVLPQEQPGDLLNHKGNAPNLLVSIFFLMCRKEREKMHVPVLHWLKNSSLVLLPQCLSITS